MMGNRDQLLKAASELSRSFEIDDDYVTVANTLFPAKAIITHEQDQEDVTKKIRKVATRAPSAARTIKRDVEILRADVDVFCRPDSSINCLLKMKKAHLFRMPQPNAEDLSTPSSSDRQSLGSCNGDVMSRNVKEEPISPCSTYSSSSNRSDVAKNVSKFRSPSVLSAVHSGFVESKFHNSVEKGPTTCFNPLFNSPPVNLKASKTIEASFRSIESPQRVNQPPPYPGIHMAPGIARRHMPPSVPSDVLCNELRNSLQGLPGMYFIDDGVGQLTISKGCSLSAPERNLVSRVLRTANLFIRVRRSAYVGDKGGTMKQILYDGVSTLLRDYLLDVSNISLREHVCTMKVQILSVTRRWYFHLADMEASISLGNSSPMDIVDCLYSMWTAESNNRSQVFSVLLNSCVAVFCNKLRVWLTSGILSDSEEWMIRDRGTDFCLSREPLFFCSYISNLVLKIGRSLGFVTGDDLAVVDNYKLQLINEFSANKFYYICNRNSLRIFLNNMWLVVAKNVSHRLIGEGNLIDHLRAARKFLLVEDPYFSRELHSSFSCATLGLKTTITQNAASTLFMSALRKCPSCKGFPFKVQVEVMTSENDSPNTSSRLQFIRPLRPIYIPPDICKPVFADTAELYEAIFQNIWEIEVAMLTLEEVNDRLRLCSRDKKVKGKESLIIFHRQLSFTLNSVLLVVHRLQNYARYVVDFHFTKMLAHLSDLSEIDVAAEQHVLFLNQVHNDLFLNKSHEKISINISTILQLADEAVTCATTFLDSLDERNALSFQASGVSDTKRFEEVEREIFLDEGMIDSRRAALSVMQATFTKCFNDLSGLANSAEYATRCISILQTNWFNASL